MKTAAAVTSDDTSLKRKPPYSYSTLISFAINSSPSKKMTLSDIYTWICANFPFYRDAGTGWKVRLSFLLARSFFSLSFAGSIHSMHYGDPAAPAAIIQCFDESAPSDFLNLRVLACFALATPATLGVGRKGVDKTQAAKKEKQRKKK